MTFVRTVTGDIEPGQLGPTYCHEHMLAHPASHLLERPGGSDLEIGDHESSLLELRLFHQAGGRSYVDCTTREYGRDARGLQLLSRRSGVHAIACTGYAERGSWRSPDVVAARSESSLAAEMIAELTECIPGADGVRAGVIKAGTSLDCIHPSEERVLRAAARAQQETGAPITTHTTAGTMAVEQARILETAGADLSHTVIGHLDRRLAWDELIALARAGCRLGFDCVSKEQYAPDARRIEVILRLIEEGHGDQILLSGDLARRSYLTSYGGGPGLTYILWRFVPWLWQAGASRADTDRMLVANPAWTFSWEA